MDGLFFCWITGSVPRKELTISPGPAVDRKYRLIACAAVRRIWHLLTDEPARRAVEVAVKTKCLELAVAEEIRDSPRVPVTGGLVVNEYGMLGQMLLSEINLAYYQEVMAGMRAAIGQGRFAEFSAVTRETWERGDIPVC